MIPAIAAGSIFTFSLSLGDYITPQLVTSTQFIGNVVYANVGIANNLPLAAAFATVPVVIMIFYLLGVGARARSRRSDGGIARRSLAVARGLRVTLAFLYAPLIVIAIYAFNKTRVQTWPPTG